MPDSDHPPRPPPPAGRPELRAWAAAPPPPPPDPTRPEGTNGFAVASLVLSFIAPCGAGLISIALGIVALVLIKRSRQKGKGLAITGLAITGAWLVALAVIVAIGLLAPQRDSTEGTSEGGQVSTRALAPGDCVNCLREQVAELTSPVVPCAEAHEGGVYAAFDLTLDGGWPGEDAIIDEADTSCLDHLGVYSPEAYEDEAVEVWYLYPTAG